VLCTTSLPTSTKELRTAFETRIGLAWKVIGRDKTVVPWPVMNYSYRLEQWVRKGYEESALFRRSQMRWLCTTVWNKLWNKQPAGAPSCDVVLRTLLAA